MMKKLQKLSTACLLVILFLVSCHTTDKVVTKSNYRKPKFIDDIYLGGHNKNNVTENGVDNQHVYASERRNYNTINGVEPQTPNAKINPAESNTLKEKYAVILGVLSKQITNYSLYKFIDEWYGVAYRLGGSTKNGIDCSAFAQKLYSEVYGVDLFRTAFEQSTTCIPIKDIKEAVEGDLIFFHTRGSRVSHVGIYLMNDFFVHASSSQGIVISSLNDEYWHEKFSSVGRLPRG